jgi:NRPS condensation-like uncharacterized protein
MGVMTTLRFKTKHSPDEIHEAMRYLLSIYPRLRSFLEPTFFSFRLRILDDDKNLDLLFNDVFEVLNNTSYGSDDYLEYRRALLNEPFSLENELPIRMRYIPDEPGPVLLFSIHHIIADGSSLEHMLHSLMSYLNGDKPPLVPLDSPNMMPALLEKHFFRVPQQIIRSYKTFRDNNRKCKGKEVVSLLARPTNSFGPVDLHQEIIVHDLAMMQSKLRESGYTITVLILAALTISLCRTLGKDNKNTMVSILVSVDLRPYFNEKPPVFGNFVWPLMVHIFHEYWDQPKRLLEEINSQLGQKLSQLRRKEDIFRFIIIRLLTYLGKKNYKRIMKMGVKRREGAFPITCQFSNLGSLDSLNSHGKMAQVCEAIPISPNFTLFITVSGMNGQLNSNFVYPDTEYTRDQIRDLVRSIKQSFIDILRVL